MILDPILSAFSFFISTILLHSKNINAEKKIEEKIWLEIGERLQDIKKAKLNY